MAQPNRPRRGNREENTGTTTSETAVGEQTSSARESTSGTASAGGSGWHAQSGNTEPRRDDSSGNGGMAQKIREQVNARLSSRKDQALEGVGGVTEAIRQTSRSLRDNQHDTIARYLEQAVGQVDRLTETLRQKDIRELMLGAQRLARRRPAIFVGSAFAIGLISARFFKSSAPNDEADDIYYSAGEYRTRGTARFSSEQSFTPSRGETDLRGFERER